MAHPRKADVLVADSEPVARSGLVHLINSHPDLQVCAEAEALPGILDLCERHRPGVLVLEPAMGDGFSLIKDLPKWSPETRVVAFTRLDDALSVQRAYQAGVCGYVMRTDPLTEVIAAVVGAGRGKRHVGPYVAQLIADGMACGMFQVRGNDEAALSNREREIFRLIGMGRGTRAIAEELRLSVKTVETHRQRIREKLKLRDGAELARRATLAYGNGGGG